MEPCSVKAIYKPIVHLWFIDPELFRAELTKLNYTEICRVDKKGCGMTKHISEFSHRPRKRPHGITVDVDPICKPCMNHKRKIKDAQKAGTTYPEDNQGQSMGNGKKRLIDHTGPLPGSVEHLFFCGVR